MTRFIGIDISKAAMDTDVSGQPLRLDNSLAGWEALAKAFGVGDIAVMESSGGYEKGVASFLRGSGIAVAVVNPAEVAAFRKGLGFKAKTDAIDARVLSRFGETRHLDGTREAPDPRLAGLVTRRGQLIAARSAEKQRLECAGPDARASIQRMIACLDDEIARIEKAIEALIEASAELTSKRDLLLGAPGVGHATAALVLAQIPELGRIGPRQLASLAGLAPHARESGNYRGQRHIGRGRSDVRRGLFMAVMGGARGSNFLREMMTRLKAAGKTHKQAVIACARKLLIVLNAMIRDRRPFEAARYTR